MASIKFPNNGVIRERTLFFLKRNRFLNKLDFVREKKQTEFFEKLLKKIKKNSLKFQLLSSPKNSVFLGTN